MHSEAFVSPDFSSAEAQRQWYLRQLGVSTCFPRFVLPGALPSELCDLPVVAVPQPAVAPHEVAPDVGAAPAAPASSEARTIPRKPVFEDEVPAPPPTSVPVPREPVSAGAAPAAAIDPAARLQFRMVLLRAERGLVVCNQVPLQHREGLGQQETRLLHNILHWLGTALLPERQRLFAWPPPGMEDQVLAADGKLAGRSLFGFLEQAQQEGRFSRLLLLGSSGPQALQGHLQSHGQSHGQSDGTALPWQQFHSHSLGEMLVNAELKREAWQAMVPLHALLQAE